MTNSEQAIREIAEKHFPCVGTRNDREYRKMEQDALVSSITSLISEHYVAKAAYIALENTLAKAEAKNLELLQQRDELREALINVMAIIKDCYPLLFDNEKPAVKQAEAAIKNTETK